MRQFTVRVRERVVTATGDSLEARPGLGFTVEADTPSDAMRAAKKEAAGRISSVHRVRGTACQGVDSVLVTIEVGVPQPVKPAGAIQRARGPFSR